MARRTDFRQAVTYTGQNINKPVTVSLKIDGVRILYRDGKFVTRNNKTPPGLDIALSEEAKDKIRLFKDCEVYAGSFVKSNSPMQSHNPEPGCLTEDMVYPLDYEDIFTRNQHAVDPRLIIGHYPKLSKAFIRGALAQAVQIGFEGLVLRTADRWYRVKPNRTADVFVTGYFEQYDKNNNPKNQLGGFTTAYGNVTAFTEEMRKILWDNPAQYIGSLIQVQYKELHPSGNFRYTVKFIRFRYDKDTESFDQ